jgi:drug/metabolite transporter (DMT)-like permease
VNRARAAELGLIGVAAVWGGTFVMVQDAIAKLPTLAFLGYRFLAAAIVVAIVWRGAVRALPASGWRAGALMGVFLTLGYVLQTLGLEHTTVSNAGFITGLFVVMTPVLAAVFLGDRIGPLAWGAAGVSALGLYLLSGGGSPNTGDVLVLGCAVAFAAHILATARAASAFDTGALLVVQLSVCGVVCTVGALVAGDLKSPPDSSVWIALVVTALVATVLGFFIQTYAQKHTSATRTALILSTEPAFTALCGYLFNDDRLKAMGWVGAGLIMASILAVELVPRLRPPRPLPEEA